MILAITRRYDMYILGLSILHKILYVFSFSSLLKHTTVKKKVVLCDELGWFIQKPFKRFIQWFIHDSELNSMFWLQCSTSLRMGRLLVKRCLKFQSVSYKTIIWLKKIIRSYFLYFLWCFCILFVFWKHQFPILCKWIAIVLIPPLTSTKERKSYGFGTTCRRVDYDRRFIFVRTIPLKETL